MIVAEALRAWVAAARGALEWHLETGDLDLPVPDGFRRPPLGTIAPDGWRPDPARLSAPAPAGAPSAQGFARLGDVAAALAPAAGQRPAPPRPAASEPAVQRPAAPVAAAPVAAAPVAAAPVESASAPLGFPKAQTVDAPAARTPIVSPPVVPADLSGEGPAAAAASLAVLRAEIGDCQRCPLSQSRTELVFGVGDPQARLMCVADRPSMHDDLVGLPFADEAGALLGKMVRAMTLDRSQVYLTHLVKCRDARGADPGLDACAGFLQQQLAIIRPTVILALGDLAAQRLTGEKATLPHLRGKWFEYQGVPVRATFHPTALNHPQIKREAWNDLKMVMRKLGISLARR